MRETEHHSQLKAVFMMPFSVLNLTKWPAAKVDLKVFLNLPLQLPNIFAKKKKKARLQQRIGSV